MSHAGPEAAPAPNRGRAAWELAAVTAAAALLLAMFSEARAGGLSLVGRVIVPARLLLLVLLATVFLRRDGEGWSALGLRRPPRLWIALAVMVVGLPAGELAAGAVVKLVYPLLHVPAPGVPPFLAHIRGRLGEYLYWLVPVTWGSAAFGEEMLFRGFVLDRLDQLLGRGAIWVAVVLQGLLFGAAHAYLSASGAIVAGVLGLVLGAAYVAGGRNLWPCIVIHGLVDTLSITGVFLGLAHR